MKRSLLLVASTAGLLCLAAGPASAQMTPQIQWSYNFTPTQSFVAADSPGTGTVTFTNEPGHNATNSSDVVVTNLRVSSTAPSTTPDTLTNAGYGFALQLKDTASGATSSTLLLNGQLGGSFSSSNSNVTNTFTAATLGSGWTTGTNGSGQTTYSWTAPGTVGNPNGNVYTVNLTGYTPPGPPTAANAGSISAHVDVGLGTGHTSSTPEPSTLVLSGLGLAFAGAASWRKRRRSLASMLA
jgi:hypothetical protein